MLDGLSLPHLRNELRAYAQWFVYLKQVIAYPLLQEDEKILWIWLATQSANDPSSSCSLSYEQIASAVNKPTRGIHRILFRLKIMGLLQAYIPIWYGEPTLAMVQEVRAIKLIPPLKILSESSGLALPRYTQPRKPLNLLHGKLIAKGKLKKARVGWAF